MVDEQSLKALLKAHGWRLNWTRLYQTRYGYAKRREGGKQLSRYMGSDRTIERLTEQDVLKKLGIEESQS